MPRRPISGALAHEATGHSPHRADYPATPCAQANRAPTGAAEALQKNLSADTSHHITTRPRLGPVRIPVQRHPPAPAQAGALVRGVAFGQVSISDQPLRQAGVQAAGDRVFGDAHRCAAKARTSSTGSARFRRSCERQKRGLLDSSALSNWELLAPVLRRLRPLFALNSSVPCGRAPVAIRCLHAVQQQAQPDGAVVQQLRGHNLARLAGPMRRPLWPAGRGWGCCVASEGAANASCVPSRRMRHQSFGALLHDHVGSLRVGHHFPARLCNCPAWGGRQRAIRHRA